MTRRTRWLAGCLLALLPVWGCTEPACQPPTCDVKDRDCQRRVMLATACIRGVSARKVNVRVVQRDQFVADTIEQVDVATKELFRRRSEALAAIGLERYTRYDDAVAQYAGRVGAFYSPRSDDVTLFDGGSGVTVETLVHEFAHALQHDALSDQDPDESRRPRTLNADLARSAMFEGDATLTTDRATLLAFGTDPDEPNWQNVYQHWVERVRRAYAYEPLPVTLADRYFVYAHGAAFLEPVLRQRGQRTVIAWVDDPPNSARAVMAGFERARSVDRAAEGSYDPSAWPPPARDAGTVRDAGTADAGTADAGTVDAGSGATQDGGAKIDASVVDASTADTGIQLAIDLEQLPPFTEGTPLLAPVLPGLQLIALDSLGAFVFDGFARKQFFPSRFTPDDIAVVRASAQNLLADHLSLSFDPATDNVVAVYRLHFDRNAATEAWGQYPPPFSADGGLPTLSPGGGLRSLIVDRDVVLVASKDDRWLRQLDLQNLPWRAFDAATVPSELRAGGTLAASFWPNWDNR